MSTFFTIQCSCSNSLSARKQGIRQNPSGAMKCKSLLADGSTCSREYDNTELIRIMDTGTEVYYAPPLQPQIALGEGR